MRQFWDQRIENLFMQPNQTLPLSTSNKEKKSGGKVNEPVTVFNVITQNHGAKQIFIPPHFLHMP